MSAESERVDADTESLEAALAALRPRSDRLDRDRLMFLAGQASASRPSKGAVGRRYSWLWPAGCAAMSVTTAALLLILGTRPNPQIVERIVEVPVEKVSPAAASSPVRPGERAVADSGESGPRRPPLWPHAKPRAAGWIVPDLSAWPAEGYPQLLRQMLTRGVDAWPASAPVALPAVERAMGPATYRELLDEMLDTPVPHPERQRMPKTNRLMPSGAHS